MLICILVEQRLPAVLGSEEEAVGGIHILVVACTAKGKKKEYKVTEYHNPLNNPFPPFPLFCLFYGT